MAFAPGCEGDADDAGADDAGAGAAGGSVGSDAGQGEEPVDRGPARLRPGAVIVHLFEWKWTDIARECENHLGPRGFDAVQISPPSEHALIFSSGYPWWQRYQVVSYELESRSGSREEFVDMVERCGRAGVDIYVDAVINHMTAQTSGVGSGGTQYTKYEYPGLYTRADFHSPTCEIQGPDYATNAEAVRSCELLGLSDLDTGAPAVQEKIAAYLIELVELGVRGFRIDAAKHMAPEDIAALVARVGEAVGPERAPYYFLEVIDYGEEAISSREYLDVAGTSGSIVDITEFKHVGVGDKFRSLGKDRLADLADWSEAEWDLLPSDRAVSFVTNHDTQRGNALYYAEGAPSELATLFLLAWPYGVPQLLSGYAFDRNTNEGLALGPPSDDSGRTHSIYTSGDEPDCAPVPRAARPGEWVCEHRAPGVAELVRFREVTAGAPVTSVWHEGANQLAFGREGKGFIAFNLEAAPLERSFQTDLPPGRYCELLGAAECDVVTVDESGQLTLVVPPGSARAVHVEARAK